MINLNFNPEEERKNAKAKVKSATERKKASEESLEDAYKRVTALKNSEKDIEKIEEVFAALKSGEIARHPSDVSKRLSKAEITRLHALLADNSREEKLAEMVKNAPSNYYLVDNEEMLKFLKKKIDSSEYTAVDCETFDGDNGSALDPYTGEMAGFSVSTKSGNNKHHFYVPLQHTEKTELTEGVVGPGSEVFGIKYIFRELKESLEKTPVIMHNAPFDLKWFKNKYGIDMIDNLFGETRIMSFMLNENQSHALKDIATLWLRKPSDNFDTLFKGKQFNEIPLDIAMVYACKDTDITMELFEFIMEQFNRDELSHLKKVFYEMELPVHKEFVKADMRGIRFDTEKAAELDKKFGQEEQRLVGEIQSMLGEININSPVQLSNMLFNELKLPNPDKGSTGVKTLKKIEKSHPVIPLILEIREISKLRSAFTQALPREIKHDGKIHPWFNTVGAKTFRMSCSRPNVQQIPAKHDEIRKLFLSDPDRMLISIDYSQIELRVLAHLAKEKVLINAFETGKDLHSTTGAQVYFPELPFEDAYNLVQEHKDTPGHKAQKARKHAKTLNFGIVYGMSAHGLSDQLGVSKEEAQQIIDDYFKAYPGIKGFMDEMKKIAKKNKYVPDMFGRKRRFHEEFASGNGSKIHSALRMAGNYPIQASAGGILKVAIRNLVPILAEMNVEILMAIHDEIVFNAPKNLSFENLMKIKNTMESAVPLIVPVKCDVEISPERWMDIVKLEDYYENTEIQN